MAERKVLVTGVTGFIGGTVLTQLLESSDEVIKQYSLSVVVRRHEQAETLRSAGIRTIVIDDLGNAAALKEAASEHDIVMHLAIGFHTTSARALIGGLGERKRKTGSDVHYIHLSGTSNLAILTISEPNLPVRNFSDLDEDIYDYEQQRETLEPYAQRTTDVTVVSTGEKLDVKTYIVMAPQVYGQGTGKFNQGSQQLPLLVRNAIQTRRSEFVSPGTGGLGSVEVQDLARLFEITLAKTLRGADLPSGRKGYYFANTASATWIETADVIGKIGHALGVLESSVPRSITLEEAARRFHGGDVSLTEHVLAASSKTEPKRSLSLGWEPLSGKSDWEKSIEATFKVLLEE
ncbi:hypothetical protein M426DRAFT_319281 [Hypoxylon sp. CI-4A]|nr:hypothetical protein M426DRAFT_319281 [Hypoxylon sp. CI-4A]